MIYIIGNETVLEGKLGIPLRTAWRVFKAKYEQRLIDRAGRGKINVTINNEILSTMYKEITKGGEPKPGNVLQDCFVEHLIREFKLKRVEFESVTVI